MGETDNKRLFDQEISADSLAEFAPRVREILRQYRNKRKLASIAKQLGFHPSRLTEMIRKDGNGEYKLIVTPYYLAKFIEGGIVDVEDLLQGRRLEDLSENNRLFFERMMVPRETLRLVIEARQRGINIERILKEILYPNIA